MRTLGFAEAFLAEFHSRLDGGLVTVAMARLKAIPRVDQLNRALRVAFEQNLLLRCEIAGDEKGVLRFRERTDWMAPRIVERTMEPLLCFEELLGTPLQAERPLFEFVLVKSSKKPHAFLKMHHAIADGTALRGLLNEILEGTSERDSNGGQQSLSPCVEERMASTRGSFGAALPPPEGMEPWQFHARTPLSERKPRVFLREFSCIPLLKRAREKRVKLNSLLMEAVVSASRELPGFPEKSALILPVSVRQRLTPKVPDEEIGCVIGNALVYFGSGQNTAAETDAAFLERQLSASLDAAITGPADFPPDMVHDAVGSFLDPERQSFEYPLGLSNLGRDQHPSPLLEALWFAASVRPGHLGILTTVSTVEDRLCLAFHFAEPLVQGEAVSEFVDRVEALLQEKG